MDTLEVLVTAGPDLQDVLVAELADLGFEAFQTDETGLRAYAPAQMDGAEFRSATSAAIARISRASRVRFTTLPARNWNEEWERAAVPVEVGPFVILPSWSDAEPGERRPLWIDPKMSFGTGHHESTRLALRLMAPLVRPGASVLDVGTGTGVLAIGAALLGAAGVVAVDVDAWSARNCVENIERNGVSDTVRFFHGDLSAAGDGEFDVIVANINRNVLMGLIPRLAARLRKGGVLVLSGLLAVDRDVILGAARRDGLSPREEAREGEWWAAALVETGG